MIAGLGNPGERYAGTRHNVGFAVAHRLVDRLGARPLPRAAEYAAWLAPAGDLAVVTPLGFMNRSGEALAAFGARHGFLPEDCLVVVDDVWLPLGRLRLRARGSPGGHNGLASIAAAFGGGEWPRLRIGVGRGAAETDLAEHVLAAFDEDEVPALRDALDRSTEAALLWAAEGITAAMNRYNVPARDARDDTTPAGER